MPAANAIADYLLGKSSLDGVSNALYGFEASAMWASAVSRMSSATGGNPWTTGDFLSHYFAGSGEAVHLSTIGLGNLYLSHTSVISLTGTYMSALQNLPLQSFWLPQIEIGHTDVTDTIFALGKSALYAAGGCQGADCFFRFTINDKFEDPVHVGFEMPFGAPYPIVYEWSVVKRRARRW